MKKWRSSLIVLLTGCLLLTACNSHSSTAVPPSALPSDDVQENGQVLTVISPEMPKAKSAAPAEPTEAQRYQIQTRLTDFQLLNETTGIAWGLTRGELRLYLTEDNGVTWRNISPAATVQFSTPVNYGRDLFFLNNQDGWIIREAQGGSESILLRTEDGGMNWKVSSLPDEINPASLYFLSASRGWIMSADSTTQGIQTKTLYLTNDGGISWIPAGNGASQSGKTAAQGTLPNSGDFSSMVFTSLRQGYVLTQNLHQANLYSSADGGRNWKSETLPIYPELEAFNKHMAGPITTIPTAYGQETAVYIPLISATDNATQYAAYFIKAGESANQFVPFTFPGPLDNTKASLAPIFLNDQEGWSLQGGILYHTLDQGKTWTALPNSKKLLTTLEEYPEVVKLQFITPDLGWILVQNSAKNSSRLLQTRDGGESWQML